MVRTDKKKTRTNVVVHCLTKLKNTYTKRVIALTLVDDTKIPSLYCQPQSV